ncbi:hypothetical protein, partial [uncultured Dialister sp.]|uniref:hypothetical protein n=1 Tax=uncultured Dialister sp. TaxID=278064 RepID=UPI0025E61CC5
CTFLQIPPHDGHPWCSAMTFPLSGGLGTFILKSAPMLGAPEKERNPFEDSSLFILNKYFFY